MGKYWIKEMFAAKARDNTLVRTIEEAVSYFLSMTYTRDLPDEQRGIVQVLALPSGWDLAPPRDVWDFLRALDRPKIGRSPGLDKITPAVIKHLGGHVEIRLLPGW